MSEPTLPVSQPELPTLEAWLTDMFPGADLDKLEIPGRVVVEIAKSYAAAQLAERDRELQQAREQATTRLFTSQKWKRGV